ncbi:hypothetical protein PG985_009793 [Apiospora marii]|uniref:uncharacterized protein n=1 Tax=Apiospora marii TaxID=335849 RepID=UPI0031313238
MISTLYILLPIVAAVCFTLVKWIHRPRDPIWAQVDRVGGASRLSFLGSVLSSITSTRKLATEGYRRFSKTLDRPYALPTTWMRSGAVMVLPPSRVPLMTRPDKTHDGEWTNLLGLIETTQLPYLIDDPTIYQNLLHFDVVRRHMTSTRDVARHAPTTADELDRAFGDAWGTSSEWKTIDGWEACGGVISRASQRVLVGLPLSRDPALLETSRAYANSVLVGGAIINCFPSQVRWLVAPLVAARARYYQSRYVNMLVPLVRERIRMWEEKEKDDGHGPDDFLQWMIPICAQAGPDQLDPTRIALRLVSLLTPLVFAICYVFAHCVLDILGGPDRRDIVAGLEEECTRVMSLQNGSGGGGRLSLLDTSEAVSRLSRVDSALRESMRLSDVAVTNLARDVTAGEVDVGQGLRVKPGVRMVFPTQNIHRDPDNYEDPTRYDAFRFSRPFEKPQREGSSPERPKPGPVVGEQQKLIVTTTPTFLPFGYGRHACPGRWFAAQLMKQALAYVVLHYDVQLVGGPQPRRALLNTMVPPVGSQIRIRRKG